MGKNSLLIFSKNLIKLYDLQKKKKTTKAAKVNQIAAKVKKLGQDTLKSH